MIDGYKMGVSPEATIPSSRKVSGIIFLIVFTAFVSSLVMGFDPETRKLDAYGFSLTLGKKKKSAGNSSPQKNLQKSHQRARLASQP